MPRPGLGTWKIMFFLGKRSIEIVELPIKDGDVPGFNGLVSMILSGIL